MHDFATFGWYVPCTMSTSSDVVSRQPEFYTLQEAATVLNVDPRTLRKAIDDGFIPSVMLGEKTVRIPVAGLRELWAKTEGVRT